MTAYNLSPGKSWVTGESVTATKMNTALTGSTTTITNNLIGQASSTTDNIPQWSDTTGALLKDGKIFTTDVDSGSLDTEVPSAKACYDGITTGLATINNISAKIYANAVTGGININNPVKLALNSQSFTSTGYTIDVSTNYSITVPSTGRYRILGKAQRTGAYGYMQLKVYSVTAAAFLSLASEDLYGTTGADSSGMNEATVVFDEVVALTASDEINLWGVLNGGSQSFTLASLYVERISV